MPEMIQSVPHPSDEPKRMKLTREMCRFLEEGGLLSERYELIEGDIISKMGSNRPHARVIILISIWLQSIFGGRFVELQNSVDVPEPDFSTSEPEPEIVVTSEDLVLMEDAPNPTNVLLLVEVSDSTLNSDKTRKAALYARAGFVEYWIADVNARQIIVHREPTATGYQDIKVYASGETVSLLARPDQSHLVEGFFPEINENNPQN